MLVYRKMDQGGDHVFFRPLNWEKIGFELF